MAKVIVCPDCGTQLRLYMDGANVVVESIAPDPPPKKTEDDLIGELIGPGENDGADKKQKE